MVPTLAPLGFSVLLFAILVSCAVQPERDPEDDPEFVSYNNYTLYRVFPSAGSENGLALDEDPFYESLILNSPDPRHPFYEILVPPHSKSAFLQDITGRQWTHEVLDVNVQETIDEERRGLKEAETRDGGEYRWDRYQSYEEMNTWMMDVSRNHANEVTLFNMGKTSQGRATYGLRFSRGGDPLAKKAIFIEAGVHSREWIAPATSTWMLNHLLTSEDPNVQQMGSDYTWYVVPLTNPDGYVFTRTNRMWRKNRRRGVFCPGTDINRNWNYHWREAGSSGFQCSDTYAGPSAMSEPETRNLDLFMDGIKENVKLYLSFHAYSQLLLWPEGHTEKRVPEHDHYEQIGKATVDAIAQRYGTEYERGSINEAIYAASGSTIDYMRATYKIPLAFCFELRPSRSEGNGGMGFVLPPDQIVPTAEETFDGLSAMVSEGKKLGYL